MSTTNKQYLFTYGTLRPKDEPATHVLENHAMYDAGPFPYILPDDNRDVVGVLVEVTDEDLEQMDRYEGIDRGLYRRESANVYHLDTAERTQAWAYIGAGHWPQVIESGDWYNKEQ